MARRSPAGTGNRLVLPASVGVIGLALIGLGQTIPNRHSIQDDLTSRSTEALKSADLVGLSVSFSGRDATVTGAGDAGQADKAEDVVSTVDGVRVAKAELSGADTGSVEPPAASETPTETPAPAETPTSAETATPVPSDPPAETPTAVAAPKPAALPVGFTLADGTITVTGTVGSKAAGTALIFAVKAAGNGWKVVDRLVVDDALTAAEPAPGRLRAVTRLLATAPIGGTKLVIQYNRGSVILRGTPASAAAERALLTTAAKTVANKAAVVDGLDTPGPG